MTEFADKLKKIHSEATERKKLLEAKQLEYETELTKKEFFLSFGEYPDDTVGDICWKGGFKFVREKAGNSTYFKVFRFKCPDCKAEVFSLRFKTIEDMADEIYGETQVVHHCY